MTDNRQGTRPVGARVFWISLAVTAVALVLTMGVLLVQDFMMRRDDLLREVRVRARIIGENSTAAISFNDRTAAKDLLASLSASPEVSGAALYRGQTLFASYHHKDSAPRALPQSPPAFGYIFGDGALELVEPVLLDGRQIGAIYVRADTSRMVSAVGRFGLSAFAMLLLTLGGAYVLLARMRRDVVNAEQHLEYLAHTDPLTGLSNRNGYRRLLENAIGRAKRSGQGVALLYSDLDGFKTVNDTLGHQAGDQLLRLVAVRLTERLRVGDTVCRLGGDEFTVILENIKEVSQATAVAKAVVDKISAGFELHGRKVFVGASVGVSLYPEDAQTAADLTRNADTAMYRAKEAGRKRFAFYTQEMNDQQQSRFAIETGLRLALETGGFYLVFQPQFSLENGELIGFEALLRWNHPEFGKLGPAEYMHIAEGSDLIERIGEWVLHEACRQCRRWHDEGLPRVPVAVNVSVRQLRNENFAERVGVVLEKTGLAARYLELEITESALMDDPAAARRQLEQLHAMGVRVAMDDFGTGYSSMSYLSRLPVDKLKIDKSFIFDICKSPDDATITQAIVALGNSLRLFVVAEGVEHEEVLQQLRQWGCAGAQGYFWSRPVSPQAAAEIMRAASYRPDRPNA